MLPSARSMVVVCVFSLGILLPAIGHPACDCGVTCKTEVANCTESARVEQAVSAYECRDVDGQGAIDCEFQAEEARAACLGTCQTLDLAACLKDAKATLKACTKASKIALKVCLTAAKHAATDFKMFCKTQVPRYCLEHCAPQCFDGIQNGDETDVDCGGGTCFLCDDGAQCLDDFDCRSRTCGHGTCVTPDSCFDGKKNQDETDVDCGGSVCVPCADGASCTLAADCQSRVCNAGTCTPQPCAPLAAADPSQVNGDTTAGTLHSGGLCQIGETPAIVYVATPVNTGILHLQLDSVADLGVSVRATCESPFSEIGCADSVSGGRETLQIFVNAGAPVFILISGFREGAAGPFTLNIESTPATVPSPSPMASP